jgi:hypothetical protein
MTPGLAEVSGGSEIYELLRDAASRRQPVTAVYDRQPRVLCPHVGGRKSGRWHVFCYQFGGKSNSVEPLAAEGRGVWRCLAVDKLSQVEPHSPQQTCIDEVDFDADAQSGDSPQKGQ